MALQPESIHTLSIEPGEIRKGDRIRRTVIMEYTANASAAPDVTAEQGHTFELIERPVPLPTRPGWYVGYDKLAGRPLPVLVDSAGRILHPIVGDRIGNPERFGPYTYLRDEAEVAAEALGAVHFDVNTYSALTFNQTIKAVAARYGVTL